MQPEPGAMLEALRQVVEVESPSTDKQACDHCLDLVEELFARRVPGIVAQRHARSERGDHLELRRGQGDRPILLLCHHDTVWDIGTLKRLPFLVDGNVVRGPGAFDMKAGIVEAAFALEIARPNKAVVVLSTSDEEIGSGSSRALIEDRAKAASTVLVLEPATSGGAIKTARKGVADFTIRITGRAAHAGVEPEKGVSAIEEAAQVVLQLKQLADPKLGTTINVGVIRAGTRPNVVAAQAELQVDVRVATRTETQRVLRGITELRPTNPGARLEVLGGLDRPPMERSEGVVRLALLAKKIAAELGYELNESATGGGSDGNFTAALGVSTLDGLGPDGGGAHSDAEHLLIDSWVLRTRLLARLLEAL